MPPRLITTVKKRARYSHIRMEAKRRALESVGTGKPTPKPTAAIREDESRRRGHNPVETETDGAQNWAQSGGKRKLERRN